MSERLPSPVHFREVQHFTQWWIWAILGLVALVGWWAFIEQIVLGRPFGNRPGPDWVVWLVFAFTSFLLPLVLLLARIVTEVDDRELRVAFRPFRRKRFEASDLTAAEAVTFRPIRDFGGWGIKHSRRLGWAYTVRGSEGVRLEFPAGRSLTVGSQRSHELETAVRRLMDDA